MTLLDEISIFDLRRYAEAMGESLLKATLRVSRQIEIIEERRRAAGAADPFHLAQSGPEALTIKDGIGGKNERAS